MTDSISASISEGKFYLLNFRFIFQFYKFFYVKIENCENIIFYLKATQLFQ